MAEALVNVLLERLATISLNKVGQELKLVVGVKKEVKSLTRNLKAIQAVLEDAEQRQLTEATVRHWLSELTEVSHEMDDVLDESITEDLRRMEQEEKHGENAPVPTKEKVCFHFPCSCFCIGQVNRVMLRRDIAMRVKDLNGRIDLIAKQRQDFSFHIITRVLELPQRQKTTSLPIDKTFGREDEKNYIIRKLLSETSQQNPLIIPIVGMGGMGKTTLAQLVFNDDTVQTHFDKRIWVCVSDPFEEIKICKAIIEGLDTDNISNELQTLVSCISGLLKHKKFLLVLDDVWNPNSSQWEELVKPLRSAAIGSRVLVTTRNEGVAALMKATTQIIHLKQLGEASCLSLFYHNADMDESNVSKEFYHIGVEIAKRCNGLPLAAKALGRLMRNKKKIHEWQAVLKSKTWELKEIQQDVFRPLLLSYHDLPPATKRCLLYCAIFPKDYVFNKNQLIELWMSQDYLNVEGSTEKITVGQNCFDDLVMRSFFQNIEEHVKDGAITCKIHDIVHDFLQFLTKNECSILDLKLAKSETKEAPNDKVYHLTLVHATKSDPLRSFLLSCTKLRTLVAIDSSDNSIGPIVELIVQLKSLRTLILHPRWGSGLVEIPVRIDKLIHLRYLDLSGNNELKELPSGMDSLYNLQTLRLECCSGLKKIDVGRLINLRHLYVDRCGAAGSIIGIEKLKHLQTLDVCLVSAGRGVNKLEDLKELNQLQGRLIIKIWGDHNVAENAAIMLNKAHLLQLELEFNEGFDERQQRQVLDGLKPHAGLESLSINIYRGNAFSHWLLSLHCLRVLTLCACWNCKFLPPLGKLQSLESLRIINLPVEKVGVEFLGIEGGQTLSPSIITSFPKLKQLEFKDMRSWREWEGAESSDNNITIMPCLSELTIDGCMLKELPNFLWDTQLEGLYITRSPNLEGLYST